MSARTFTFTPCSSQQVTILTADLLIIPRNVSREILAKAGLKVADVHKPLGKKDEPFEFVKLLKSTSSEQTDYDSLIKEFEVEPRPIRNWFLKNSDSLNLMLAFFSIIVSIVIAIYL